MRAVALHVSAAPIGRTQTWAYPAGQSLGAFILPTYRLSVSGKDAKNNLLVEHFEVFRFGVLCKDGITATVVGLADHQVHRIKTWIPTYRVHSAPSKEDGAWQVYGNFLIHDGPDGPGDGLYASIGCIEVMGRQGFFRLNSLLISLCGPTSTSRAEQLAEIGRSGKLTITYDRATRPPLVRAP